MVKVKQETLPTPQGRRVIPRVTSTMKAEANRKADIKKGEGKRGKKFKVGLPTIKKKRVFNYVMMFIWISQLICLRNLTFDPRMFWKLHTLEN